MMDYFGEASETDYFENKLLRAIEKIKEFPTLSKILNKFEQATKTNHYENTFLNLAGADTEEYDSILKSFDCLIEEILSERSDNKNLINLIKSFGEKHFQKINELEFYIQLKEKESVKEIKYEGNSQKHDFNFLIDGTEFNVELTSLGKGKIEQRINEAFILAAKEIIKDLPDKTLLKIDIITDKLGEIGESISSEEISQTIVDNFNKIKLFCLVCRNDSVTLEKNIGSKDKTLFECKDYFYYVESKRRISELLKSERGVDYLKNIKVGDIADNPIDHVMIFDWKKRKVEIHAQRLMPSSTEILRKKSLVRQLKELLRGKINKGQLKGKTNPFIALNFEDFAFHNYYLQGDSFGQDSFSELNEIIKEISVETRDEELLGVLFYFKSIKKSAFIKNPNIEIDGDVRNKIEKLRS
ncbi:MAG: hypothetical protein ABIH28_00440 [archaeon]